MFKPPPDADPEKFVIGRGTYTNLRLSRPYNDDRVFRIDPISTPTWSVIVLNLIFLALCYGFHWALKNLTHGTAPPWTFNTMPIVIALLTCGSFTGVVYWQVAKARRSGPWLIYDKATGQVDLPREGLSFQRQEIICLQDITTKRLDFGSVLNNQRLSELNLITQRDGRRQRWSLLRSSTGSFKEFDHILKPLVRNTDIPVIQVRDELWGWGVTETPYM